VAAALEETVVTLSALRLSLGACVIATAAVATVAHAATPITLPLEDLGLDTAAGIDLPVPPPPRVVRPSTAHMQLVIKRQVRGGCQAETRRTTVERRQVFRPAPTTDPWSTTPVWFRLG
jgi:hypothetical protein